MVKIILMFGLVMMSACREEGYIVAILKNGDLQKIATQGKVDRKTKFRLASLTKAFTAMSMLILEEEKKIKPGDLVVKYLPEFSPMMQDIQIQHLIHHRSGLPYFGELCHSEGKRTTNKEVLAWLKKQNKTGFKPGSKYEYSNTGYVVLAEIISRISGKSYSEFVSEKIFRPLSMNNSNFHLRDPDNFNSCSFTMGEDGIYTSLDDYIKWTRAITTDVLIKDRSKIFQSPYNYSYGWELMDSPVISHYGSWMNYRTHARYYSQKDVWIIVLSNIGDIPMEKLIKEATIWVGY